MGNAHILSNQLKTCYDRKHSSKTISVVIIYNFAHIISKQCTGKATTGIVGTGMQNLPATLVLICIFSWRVARGSKYSGALPAMTSCSLRSTWLSLSLYNLTIHNFTETELGLMMFHIRNARGKQGKHRWETNASESEKCRWHYLGNGRQR